MKATDLMIGDWVQFTNTSKIRSRINCISPHQRHVAHTDNATWIDSFDLIEPVPITDEILKANGFEKIRFSSIFEFKLPNDGYIRVNTNLPQMSLRQAIPRVGLDFDITLTRHKYVHQLQHILHLCNLDDLADNFKLE